MITCADGKSKCPAGALCCPSKTPTGDSFACCPFADVSAVLPATALVIILVLIIAAL
ncbi:unnamed protein product [Dibothriocephalus latus]|uniref:Granulins domain-containing protein n=1 Tax=Dibothriocephalus latus TaxID=60516 RepID=A0A3P7Q1S3_DIBLA|nr:unnamed protein product [Dibothriocephalus latus]